jgi:putative Mn2+ efflux pump MntP
MYKYHPYKSRKLTFALFCVLVITLGALVGANCDGFEPLYTTFVGGVVGICTVFFGGNVAQKVWGPTPKPGQPVEEIPPQ